MLIYSEESIQQPRSASVQRSRSRFLLQDLNTDLLNFYIGFCSYNQSIINGTAIIIFNLINELKKGLGFIGELKRNDSIIFVCQIV